VSAYEGSVVDADVHEPAHAGADGVCEECQVRRAIDVGVRPQADTRRRHGRPEGRAHDVDVVAEPAAGARDGGVGDVHVVGADRPQIGRAPRVAGQRPDGVAVRRERTHRLAPIRPVAPATRIRIPAR
jgi:hypothetical protein